MQHLTASDRSQIQTLLDAKISPLTIAYQLNRAHSTIVREIRKHRRENESDRRRKKNYCTQRKTCYRKNLCQIPPGSCSGRCSQCKIIVCGQLCPEYQEERCPKLGRSPFVCNGCPELLRCQKRKFFYTAGIAEEEYQIELHESRKGIDASEAEIRLYDELIRSGGHKGQGIHHIMAAHPDVFLKCEKTIYNYFNHHCFSLPRGEMPRMCMRKIRTKEKIRHKIDPKYRIGRTLADFQKFIAEHPELAPVQKDSVIGKIGGKVLLTLQFECGMMLAWLRETNNSQSVIDYFNMLERLFGLVMFRKFFPVILTDNGSEFSNPTAIEMSPFTGERRTWVFFCNPNASWQKGSIENNHTNLRRILEKGKSFDRLTQNDIDLVLSHLNSYMRKTYDNEPAIKRFRAIFGAEVIEKLHLTVIPPDDVVMDPKLLRGKI